MAERICEKCGDRFIITGGLARWCTPCRTLTCKECGTEKLVSPNRSHESFCSRACRVKWNAEHIEERFWSNVDKSDDCWIWTGGKKNGYGVFHPSGSLWSAAHRFAYELTYGPIPDGLYCLHRCDNPPCVRPDHLFVGTQGENVADMMAKGRGRSYSAIGEDHHLHKVTEDDVRQIRTIYKPGVISAREVGEMFGIHEDTVRQIASRKTWKHVE